MQYQEGEAGLGEAREVISEGRGGAKSPFKVLPCGSSGSTLVWRVEMGAYRDHDVAVRGIAC